MSQPVEPTSGWHHVCGTSFSSPAPPAIARPEERFRLPDALETPRTQQAQHAREAGQRANTKSWDAGNHCHGVQFLSWKSMSACSASSMCEPKNMRHASVPCRAPWMSGSLFGVVVNPKQMPGPPCDKPTCLAWVLCVRPGGGTSPATTMP